MRFSFPLVALLFLCFSNLSKVFYFLALFPFSVFTLRTPGKFIEKKIIFVVVLFFGG